MSFPNLSGLSLRQKMVKILLYFDHWTQDHWFKGEWETISSHLGKVQLRYGGSIPWRKRPLQALLSRVLDWIDPNHCVKSIEESRRHGRKKRQANN